MATEEIKIALQIVPEATKGLEKKAFQVVRTVSCKKSLESALTTLVEEVVSTLQADRCFIVQFDEDKNPLPVAIEARSNEAIRSFIGLTPLCDLCPYLKKSGKKQLAHTEDILTDDCLKSDDTLRDLVYGYDIRGVIATPIIHEDEILCILVVHTNKPRQWNEEELMFAQVSSAQVAVSIFQAQLKESQARYQMLYQWEKKTREVLQTIRQSIDTDTIFPLAIAEMAKALNANRAFIIEFDGDRVCPVRYEYRSHEEVLPFTGIVPPWDFCPYLAVSAKNLMAWSRDTYNDKDFEGNEQWYHFSRKYTIRSIVTSPILYKDKLMNVIVFHTEEPKDWTEQELFFIKTVGDQLSTLFYQEKVREELIKAAEIKSDFLSKMSHELRTPLNSIMGYAKMVEKGMVGPLNEKQMEYMQYVGSSARHLLDLVNDLLDFSKIEAGKMTLTPEPLDVTEIIDEVKAMVAELASKNDLNISFQVQPGIGTIEADPQRFKQIMINLISNAIKFNHPEGTVSVRLNKSEDGAWFNGEVQDTGIGIPKAKLPELFNKFHQVDNSASRKHEGTGLGLVLTKELVELHGGELSVDSEENVGTTFTFKLPVASKVLQEA